jgi:hypothetical protein
MPKRNRGIKTYYVSHSFLEHFKRTFCTTETYDGKSESKGDLFVKVNLHATFPLTFYSCADLPLLWAENFYATWRLCGILKAFVICIIRIFTMKTEKFQLRDNNSVCARAFPLLCGGAPAQLRGNIGPKSAKSTPFPSSLRAVRIVQSNHTWHHQRPRKLCKVGLQRPTDEQCATDQQTTGNIILDGKACGNILEMSSERTGYVRKQTWSFCIFNFFT